MTTLGEKLREAIDKKINEEVLKRTLDAWDNHEDLIRKPNAITQEKQVANPNPVITLTPNKKGFGVSNNVVRTTFDIVRDNPNLRSTQYIQMLEQQGFKRSSTTSVIYQLLKTGQIVRNDDKTLRALQKEYTPITHKIQKALRQDQIARKQTAQAEQPKAKRKVVLIKRRKSDEGIAALAPDTRAKLQREAQAIVDSMTVVKAEGGPFEFAKPKAFTPSQIVDNLSVLHARELFDYLKKIFGGN